MNSISFFKALLLKEAVEIPTWLKSKLEKVHTKVGQGSVFTKSIPDVLKIVQDALDKNQDVDKIANSTGILTIQSPGIGYNLVLPIEQAEKLPGAKKIDATKLEGPAGNETEIKVPGISTTAPLNQFKTNDLTVIIRPKKDKDNNPIPGEYIVLSAYPGPKEPEIPRASEWDGKYAVIIPGSSTDLKELQYFHNGSEMNQIINYDDSDITDDLESFGLGSMDGQDFKTGQTYNIGGQEYKVEPKGDEFKLVLAETKQNKMNSISFFKALLMKEMDEASFTDKYNNSPKLKGGQKNLPDELQAQLVKNEGEESKLEKFKRILYQLQNMNKLSNPSDEPTKRKRIEDLKKKIAALENPKPASSIKEQDHEVGIDPSSQSMAKKFSAIKNILKKGYKNSKIEDVERYREGINFTISFITDINNEEYLKLIAELEAAIGDDAITSDYEDRVIYVELLPPYTGKDESKVMKEGEDHEVSMAHNSLKSIVSSASQLMNLLGNDEKDIPAWIQDHITNAENYINQASKNYHEYSNGEHDMDELPYGTVELPAGDEEDAEMSLQGMMEDLLEAKKKPSAGLSKKQKSTIVKKAKAGKDIGKKGKGFEKVMKAAEKGGADNPRAVAAAAMWKGAAKKAK